MREIISAGSINVSVIDCHVLPADDERFAMELK
jgi:hypothetical protein